MSRRTVSWELATGCCLTALRPLDCLVDILGVVCRLEAYSVHSCVDAWEWVHGRRLRPCWRKVPGASPIIKTALVACCDHAISPFREPSASSVHSSSTAQACGAASPRKSRCGNRQDRHTRDMYVEVLASASWITWHSGLQHPAG
jgi:hypothetical protein